MLVTLKTTPLGDCYEGTASLEIQDGVGKRIAKAFVCNFGDCPEDANLGRQLSFFLEIPSWIEAAHAAGMAGEQLIINETEEDSP